MVDYSRDLARELRKNMTEAETKLWQAIGHDQLGVRFRRQHPIGEYIVDFACPEQRLIIEVDGGQHAESQEDVARTSYLEVLDYKVLRFWNNDVLSNLEGVVSTIKNSLSLDPSPSLRKEEGQIVSPWRKDFPAMEATMNGRPLIYLDSGSSAQKPRAVIDALSWAVTNNYANIHRGLYQYSQVKTEEFEDVRKKVAAFIGAASDQSIVFTRNSTEAINLVSQTWGRKYLKSGDEIILSQMEHHANIVPWQLLREELGITLKIIPVLGDGSLDLEAFKTLLSPRVKLVSLVHISNAIGTQNNIKKIKEIAAPLYPEIRYLVDGSQSVVHSAVHIPDFDPDFFVFTGHKLYGPNGVGVLYAKPELLAAMPPYQGGGDMIETVTFEKTTFKSGPARFEAGTPPIAEVIALGAAIDYVTKIGMDKIAAHEQALLDYATDRLATVPGLTIYGTAPEKAGIISFTLEGIHTSDIAMVLDRMGIAVRTGHHCCMPLMQRFGIDGTVRVSFGLYNTSADIDVLCEGLDKVRELMG